MFWAEKIADEVIRRYDGKIKAGHAIVVRDEKTASGRVHVGSLRSASLHAIVADVLQTRGIPVEFHFEINDFDPMDGIPGYLDEATYKKYLGTPLCKIPSPESGAANFAELYGQEYVDVLRDLGFDPNVYRASELYKTGSMNDCIRLALEKRNVIRRIYKDVSKGERAEDWYPLAVICENCGRHSTTKVTDFDGETVAYACTKGVVQWADGCGHEGRVSPFNGNAKLPWKVEWAAKFKVMGVDFEGAGKDHYSKGGSREVAEAISRDVFGYEPPYGVFNEFFLVGGRKMSSSKGNAATAVELRDMLPSQMLRLLLLRTAINRQIDFDPEGDAIPVLFDTYDRLAEKYWSGTEDDDTQLFLYSHKPQDRDIATAKRFLPRFSQVAFLVQMPHMDIEQEVAKMKGEVLTDADKAELDMRVTYAKRWLENYADEAHIFKLQESVPEIAGTLSETQKNALALLASKIEASATFDGAALHELIHGVKEESGLTPQEFFSAIYLVFLGKDHGPKVGWFLSTLQKEYVVNRLSLRE